MALAPWRRLSQSVVVQNPWWVYMRDEFQLPSGKTGEYHYVHTNGSSMVVPVMRDQTLLTVKQYRYLAGRESIEFPCGSVKDGASHDETARSELMEETGYSAGRLRLLGRFNPYNGMTDEMCHVYLASHLTYVGAAPDETEEFELVPAQRAGGRTAHRRRTHLGRDEHRGLAHREVESRSGPRLMIPEWPCS